MHKVYIVILLNLLSLNLFFSFGQCLESESAFKKFYIDNASRLDPIEGIWSANSTIKVYNQYNVLVENEFTPQAAQWGIIRDGEKYLSCKLNQTVDEDKSIVIFNKTATLGLYLYQRTFDGSKAVAKANAIISSNGLLQYSYKIPEPELKYTLGKKYVKGMSIFIEIDMIKLFPSIEETQKKIPSSGTGFALSSDGLLVTNFHVVNGATSIYVRGINGDFSRSYKCKPVAEDKNNDLAIIKIDQTDFSSLDSVPFRISNKAIDVGHSCYCLGYPLRATMGDEVKLTTGVISSKSGFQGDITSYQISTPIQPGNSGGPLFDDKGNLIGVINAKHLAAENVSYAIKASYLLNLLDILPSTPNLQNLNILEGKTLVEQVKLIKQFVYIIETN